MDVKLMIDYQNITLDILIPSYIGWAAGRGL